jgi:predicted Fe-Mo cluster-binding NifX family protein
MADLTKEEYDALDEELTRRVPKLGPNGHGFFSDRGISIITVDSMTARIINAKAQSLRTTPQEVVSQMARHELSYAHA